MLDEYGRALGRRRREGLQPLDPLLEAGVPRLRDRQRGDARAARSTTCPATSRGADKFARGLDRVAAAAARRWSPTSRAPPTRSPPRSRNLTAAIAELPRTLIAGPQRARRRSTPRSRRFRRLIADLRPAVRSSGPALDAHAAAAVAQLRGLVSQARAARPRRATCARRCPTSPSSTSRASRCRRSCACSPRAPTRSSCRGATTRSRTRTSRPAGPVFQEQVKWLPGIAAESRNFDANGQYVRSLANGAQLRLRRLDDGRFFVTGLPLQGVNPPKAPGAAAAARRRAVRDAGSRPTCARTSRPRRRRPRSTTTRRPCRAAIAAAQERATEWLRRGARRARRRASRSATRRSSASQLPLLEKARP